MARFIRLRPLFRRSRTTSTTTESEPDSTATTAAASSATDSRRVSSLRTCASLKKLREKFAAAADLPDPVPEHAQRDSLLVLSASVPLFPPDLACLSSISSLGDDPEKEADRWDAHDDAAPLHPSHPADHKSLLNPGLVVQQPTPTDLDLDLDLALAGNTSTTSADPNLAPPTFLFQDDPTRSIFNTALLPHERRRPRPSVSVSPGQVSRQQSILDEPDADLASVPAMPPRKIWVRRPGASATLVQIRDGDLVDDVRSMILQKYANSLGRTFDAPDMVLRITARVEPGVQRTERTLGPEEDICRTIDAVYPDGQSVDEALLIDIPPRRTPKSSPRPHPQYPTYQTMDEYRPVESGSDYFPPMPAIVQPVMPATAKPHEGRASHHPYVGGPEHQRSISVLSTGQLPPLPSPGATNRRHRDHRPKFSRQHTSSPTIVQHNPGAPAVAVNAPSLAPSQAHLVHRMSNRPRVDSSASESHKLNGGAPVPPPMPTPPAPEAPPTAKGPTGSTPPTPSTAAVGGLHMGRATRARKGRKPMPDSAAGRGVRRERMGSTDAPAPGLPAWNMLDETVPPINVLIVEDNHINLRVLEGLMKRLRVRWQTATNGKIAVDKWRAGGFHLILMDIQMPVMNGLQATKEIRRLEKVNGIGVFSNSTPTSPEEETRGKGQPASINGVIAEADKGADDAAEEAALHDPSADRLPLSGGLFKSPIIIVALTASSLQSDRHEALAAGCNDFLTKPVHIPWLERKVKEWGCMQALIDFDGWRRWREFNEKEEAGKSEEVRAREREAEDKHRKKMEKLALLQEKQRVKKEEDDERKRRAAHRESMDGAAGRKSEQQPSVPAPLPPAAAAAIAAAPGLAPAAIAPARSVEGEANGLVPDEAI